MKSQLRTPLAPTLLGQAKKRDRVVVEAADSVADLRAKLVQAEGDEAKALASRDRFLSNVMRDKGVSLLTDPEHAELAEIVYSHLRDSIKRGWAINASAAMYRTSDALSNAARKVAPFDFRYALLYPDSEEVAAFSANIDVNNIRNEGLVEETANLIAAVCENHADTQDPDIILQLLVWNAHQHSPTARPSTTRTSASIRREADGSWAQRIALPTGTSDERFPMGTTLKSIILSHLA